MHKNDSYVALYGKIKSNSSCHQLQFLSCCKPRGARVGAKNAESNKLSTALERKKERNFLQRGQSRGHRFPRGVYSPIPKSYT
jgi:hypothetical protein